MTSQGIRFRLLRADDAPATNPHNLAYRFGLQDTKQEIVEGRRLADGTLAFDFTLKVKKGSDPKQPVFGGRFASGPVEDRFVYLSWFAIARGDYINRVKARLSTIGWQMVRAAQAQDKVITADMTGWGPGDKRKFVPWFLQARELPASNQREKNTLKKTTAKPSKGFSAEERAAMKERAQELKTEARQNMSRAEGEKAVQAVIAAMAEPDRAIAKRLHALVAKSAPALAPKTWYGMPAYAKDGNVVCFFQCAGKFKARYGTFGFSDKARLDEGAMWPTSYALPKLTLSDEAKLAALIKKAAG